MNGRLTDVIIEAKYFSDPRTGVKQFGYLDVWADAGMRETIQSVEGVHHVTKLGEVNYMVSVDPRYDLDFVMAEIESAVKCA